MLAVYVAGTLCVLSTAPLALLLALASLEPVNIYEEAAYQLARSLVPLLLPASALTTIVGWVAALAVLGRWGARGQILGCAATALTLPMVLLSLAVSGVRPGGVVLAAVLSTSLAAAWVAVSIQRRSKDV